jgi:hypothetical protein
MKSNDGHPFFLHTHAHYNILGEDSQHTQFCGELGIRRRLRRLANGGANQLGAAPAAATAAAAATANATATAATFSSSAAATTVQGSLLGHVSTKRTIQAQLRCARALFVQTLVVSGLKQTS